METIRSEDLPPWMRPQRREIDWGLLLILGFCVLNVWSFIVRPGLPHATDAELYEYRSAEVARLVEAGIPYSRWGPYLSFGYGSPLFNYLAPLPHYLAGYYEALTDTSPETAIKIFLILSVFTAGSGMYLFVRQRWNASVAILATLVYLYSPPLCFTLPYLLGNLALLMALGLLPWVLFSFDLLRRFPDRRHFWLATLGLTLFILTDTRLLLFSLPVMLVVLLTRPPTRWMIASILLAVLITVFFWLPAFVERDQISWQAVSADPLSSPISLAENLGAMPRYDLRLINPPPYRGLGVATWVLALFGVGAILVYHRQAVPDAGLLLGVGLILLITAGIPSFWTSGFLAPLPYHAQLIAIFCLSITAGFSIFLGEAVLKWLASRLQLPSIVASVGLFIVTLITFCAVPLASLPSFYSSEWSDVPTTPSVEIAAELRGDHFATLRDGIFLPAATNGLVPQASNNLLDPQNLNGRLPLLNRFAPIIHPNRPYDVAQTPLNDPYLFGSTVPLTTELYLLYYPGWTVSINNNSQPIEPSPSGQVMVQLPSGTIDLRVWLDGTPVRYGSWGLTALGLFLLLIANRRRWWSAIPEPLAGINLPKRRDLITLAIAFGLVGTLATYIRIEPGILFVQSSLGQFYSPTNAPAHGLGRLFEGIYLLGYSLSSDSISAGDPVQLTLFWQAGRPIDQDDQVEVRLVSVTPPIQVFPQIHRHPGGISTLRWRPETQDDTGNHDVGPGYIRDEFNFSLPPGDYLVQLTLGSCSTPSLMPCDNPTPITAIDPVNSQPESVVVLPQQIIHVSH